MLPGSIFAEPREGQAYAVAMCPRYGKEQFPNDADFIAHAPEDIAYLLGEVERLKALYDAAQDYIDHSPCDPDINPEQAKAWIRLQDLQQQVAEDQTWTWSKLFP